MDDTKNIDQSLLRRDLPGSSDGLGGSQPVHLADYIYVVRKHMKLILATLFLMVTLVTVFTFVMTPIYKATASLVIDKEAKKSALTGEQLDFESYASESLTFNTHFELIQSRPVMMKVWQNLDLEHKLAKEPSFFSTFKKNLKKIVKAIVQAFVSREEQGGEGEKDPYEILSGKVDVEQVRDTRLLKVAVEDEDPELARDIANAICNLYTDYNLNVRFQTTQRTLSWFKDQLGEMKRKLEESEARLIAYKEKEKIFSIEGKEKVHSQEIEEMNASYLKTRAEKLETEAKIAQLRQMLSQKDILEIPPSFAQNELLNSIHKDQAHTALEIKRGQEVYKHKHPKMIQLRTKLEQLKQAFRKELGKILASIKGELSVIKSREKALENALAEYEQKALETTKKEAKYLVLEREVTTNRELYNLISSRIKESMISQGIENAANIRFAGPAVTPLKPAKPKKLLNILLSVIFGLMTGVGAAFFLEYMDQTIRTPEDIERHFKTPVLAVIPKIDWEEVDKILELTTHVAKRTVQKGRTQEEKGAEGPHPQA